MLTGHIKRLSANLDNDTEAERLILQQQVYFLLRRGNQDPDLK